MTVTMSKQKLVKVSPKPKLPRKRKKACISACGRKKYYNTVYLARVTGEVQCKFWKDVINKVDLEHGYPLLIPTPISYW